MGFDMYSLTNILVMCCCWYVCSSSSDHALININKYRKKERTLAFIHKTEYIKSCWSLSLNQRGRRQNTTMHKNMLSHCIKIHELFCVVVVFVWQLHVCDALRESDCIHVQHDLQSFPFDLIISSQLLLPVCDGSSFMLWLTTACGTKLI